MENCKPHLIKRKGRTFGFCERPSFFFEAFTDDIDKVTSQLDEIVGTSTLKQGGSARQAYLRLEISNNCNNQCRYCHVFQIADKQAQNDFLSFKDASKFISDYLFLAANIYHATSYQINFYGGEPLLYWDVIKQCIQTYGVEYSGKKIDWTINTNGRLLTDDICRFLREYDVSLHISCDGPKKINDRVRISKEKRGTFVEIERALKLASKYQLRRQIDSVISAVNIDHLNELIDIAVANDIETIYLDLLYKKGRLLNIHRMISAYKGAIVYGISKGVSVGGCCTNIIRRIEISRQSNLKDKHDMLRQITISSDGEIFSLYSKIETQGKNDLLEYFNESNSAWESDFRAMAERIERTCNGCFLKKYCAFSGVAQYQYHTKLDNGFEDSCEFLREIVLKTFIDEKI